MKKEKLNYMQKGQRKAQKMDNKEGIKLFCKSLKKQMLYANKDGRHFGINTTQEGRMIIVMIELK